MDVSLFPRLPDPSGQTPGRRVVNMRPRTAFDGSMELVAALPPATMASLKGWCPLCRLGGQLLVTAGRATAVVDDAGGDALPSPGLVALPGEPLCALGVSADEAIVMTAVGPARVGIADGALSIVRCDCEYPPIGLRAVQVSVAAASTGVRTLSKTYSDAGRLTAADRDALVGDLEAAYLEAVAKAAAAGCMVQPALARYRLLDRRGELLFESPPVLLSLPGGSQCAGTVEAPCADGRTVSSYELSLKTWRVEVSVPAERSDEVAAVEICLSPQFHPYRAGAKGMAVAARDASGYKVRVGLPGSYRALGADSGGTESTLMKAIARMDAIERCVARINSPFGGTARTVRTACSPDADAGGAMRALDAALSAKVKRASFAEALLSAPHAMAASSAASDGSAVAWGAPRALRYAGYPLPVFATAQSDAAWHATVTVRFDGRRGVSRYVEGSGGCPSALGPVLSYPSPDARSMSILLWSDGVTRRFECSLTPDESGRRSVYISPGLQAPEFTTVSAGALIDIENADETFDDVVALCRAEAPVGRIAAVCGMPGKVHALAAVAGAEQAWDRGRSRFYAATGGGIASLAMTASTGACSVRMVERRGVSRSDALAAGDGEIYALVEGGGGRVPVALMPRGAVRPLAQAADYLFLLYDRLRGELWAVSAGGRADVFSTAGMYSRTLPPYTAAVCASGEYYGLHTGGVDRVSVQSGSGRVAVEYADTFSPAGRRPFSLRSVVADIAGDSIGATLAVGAAGLGANVVRPIAERRFSGAVRSPMEMAAVSAPARSLSVRLSGMAGAGTCIRSFTFRLAWIRK